MDDTTLLSLSQLESQAIKLEQMNPLWVFKKRLELEEKLSDEDRDLILLNFRKIEQEIESENPQA